jgi:ABC-type transport system substrate-binding protein
VTGPLLAVLLAILLAVPLAPALWADTLRLAYPAQPRSLDPHQFPPDPASWPIIMTSYRRLFDLRDGTTELDSENSAAMTYRVSDDGLTYTIVLREGRTFTDGTPVDTQAALFSFDRLMSGQTGQRYFPFLRSLEVVGPYTFRFHLDRPWPPFLASLTTPMASLVSPGLARRGPAFLERATLGSGRFEVDGYSPGSISLRLRLDLPSVPRLDRVEFVYLEDPRARLDLLAAGGAHLAWDAVPGPGQAGAVALGAPSFETRFLAFNMTRSYLKLAGVREALAGLARAALESPDPSVRPSAVFPNGLAPGAPLAEDFSPERAEGRAAELLGRIGPSRIPLDLVYRADDARGREDAEKLAAKLSAYNLPVRLVPLQGSHGQGLLEKADWDLLIDFRRPELPSPEMWLGLFLDSRSSVRGNPARFSSAEADGLIGELNTTVRRDREVALTRLATLAAQDKPYVMLYQRMVPLAVDPRLQGLRPHPMWPEVWPIDETNLDPFKPAPRVPEPAAPAGPLIKDFDDPVAEPYE